MPTYCSVGCPVGHISAAAETTLPERQVGEGVSPTLDDSDSVMANKSLVNLYARTRVDLLLSSVDAGPTYPFDPLARTLSILARLSA